MKTFLSGCDGMDEFKILIRNAAFALHCHTQRLRKQKAVWDRVAENTDWDRVIKGINRAGVSVDQLARNLSEGLK